MARKRVILLSAAALLVLLTVVAVVLQRQRVRRHRVFRPAAGEVKPEPLRGAIPPVEQWTEAFQQLQGEELADLLEAIEQKHPDLYRKDSLAYLHARALVEENENAEAAAKLAPFLEKGHPFRDRALYHRASIADGAEASRYRNALIFEYRDSMYRDEAIDEELEYLADDPQALSAFAEKIAPSASTERRREISARIVEVTHSLDRGLALLNGGTSDDAADRVTRALDRPEILAKLSVEQLALFGETFQRHRHYDRAAFYAGRALARPGGLKPALRDDLQFSLGRSYFGAEKYAEAQAAYLRGAGITKTPGQQCTFFWHAARAAQLQGDDKTAEQLMTRAIAVKGKFPATLAALTQRLRTRLKARRLAEAGADLALLRKMAPNERAVLEGALAYATGMLAAGNTAAAVSALNSVPAKLLDDYDRAEFAYWRARALEQRDPPAAFRAYLDVLRSKAPSHFAYLARTRLDSEAMAPKLARELALREAQVKNLVAGKQLDLARRIQTDRILLSSRDQASQRKILAGIYRQLPAYAAVLDLKPAALPRFPNVDANDPSALLMAMGLHDEATSAIEKRWALRPQSSALTRSYALNLGGASKQSIYAIEVLMKSVPGDFHPDLLPEVVRRLLYPRYFYAFIAEDAKKFEADPTLVLSIMREESRFNPRAKSQAAARGLLQFIITTARDIGRDVGLVDVDPEDLYDPRVIIRLGAKYI
ncbi:MAG TPA: lytic transglycosylase domain-containing protein, partial [Thermoanaerobaculia bacterium]|nr:lytic transglycosylase domain-containing protein [Thermoanaerobaculia bacterium]